MNEREAGIYAMYTILLIFALTVFIVVKWLDRKPPHKH